jgi:hypothetical protein
MSKNNTLVQSVLDDYALRESFRSPAEPRTITSEDLLITEIYRLRNMYKFKFNFTVSNKDNPAITKQVDIATSNIECLTTIRDNPDIINALLSQMSKGLGMLPPE